MTHMQCVTKRLNPAQRVDLAVKWKHWEIPDVTFHNFLFLEVFEPYETLTGRASITNVSEIDQIDDPIAVNGNLFFCLFINNCENLITPLAGGDT